MIQVCSETQVKDNWIEMKEDLSLMTIYFKTSTQHHYISISNILQNLDNLRNVSS